MEIEYWESFLESGWSLVSLNTKSWVYNEPLIAKS